MRTVDDRFEVKVAASGVTGGAHIPDDLALFYVLAIAHSDA